MTEGVNPPAAGETKQPPALSLPASANPRASQRIRPAVEGDLIPAGNWFSAGVRVGTLGESVGPRCAATSPASYVCIPCRQYLANRHQLELHTMDGEHTVARVCSLHGAEEI